ncbi:unnamed protein product [Caenorhabditis nigoni]|uniref:Ubiquitin-conjugating enzyme E2 J2 n=1 Tax=Caenorhabditis nigoni TaxID=1611254 RepID=A0A2G5SCJ9_9PELO|nr:hypothetical protein B9Z55_028295 [Caenorhabditis nigoni]
MLNLPKGPGVAVPPPGSASATAIRRLQKDFAKLMQDPVDGIKALPNEENILEWHYCLRGSPDTPFQGGFYWGKVIFKENFPWSPPAITMITPNGRFATNTRLCLSISDYHPESWNPGWTVSAILIGLHSFMNENQPAAGSVAGTPQEQRNLAAASKEFNVKYREFRHFFPQYVQEWTGVIPSPDEPNVAPKMLPEHATPTGIPVPDMAQHSSRAAYANRGGGFDDMMNVLRGAGAAGQRRAPPVAPAMYYAAPQPAPVPAAAMPPALYHDLAALAAQQRQQAQQNAQAVQQAAAAVMGVAPVAAAPAVPVAAPVAAVAPQQRTLRPRGGAAVAAQPQQPEVPVGRQTRRATRRNQNNAPEAAAVPAKRRNNRT